MSKTLSPAEERFMVVRRQGEGDGGVPPPPYQVGGVHLKHVGIRFAPGVARRLLPPELDPVDSESGLISVYSTASGSGIGAFSSFFAAVAVKGFDAPDGSPAHYIAAGHYSGVGNAFMRRHYNTNVTEGSSRQFAEGELSFGVGSADDTELLRIVLRPAPGDTMPAAGVRNYLGRHPESGTCVFPIAFSGHIASAEPVSVEISDLAPEITRLARPAELVFAFECTGLSLTYGLPQRIESGGLDIRASQAALLDGFAHGGRAAIIVSPTGEVNVISDSARRLLGDGLGIAAGRLVATHRDDQRSLEALLADTAGHPGMQRSPISVQRHSGHPLILDAVPIGDTLTGRPALLLLLNDPAYESTGTSGLSLQLLGLTPAEARIAELVGSGLSPRETAGAVDNSEGTVRTSLSRIYSKLGINRQAELARLVSRLEMSGPT